jgi:hypothetical protein
MKSSNIIKAEREHTGVVRLNLRSPVIREYSYSKFKTNSQLARGENREVNVRRADEMAYM